MRIILILSTLMALGFAIPVCAETVNDLYEDAGVQADQGNSRLQAADWQFRDGNVQEGCRIMEEARVHYEQAYKDMNAMDEMVHDPSNGYSQDDQDRTMTWIHQQQATLNDIAAKMAETYYAKCQ